MNNIYTEIAIPQVSVIEHAILTDAVLEFENLLEYGDADDADLEEGIWTRYYTEGFEVTLVALEDEMPSEISTYNAFFNLRRELSDDFVQEAFHIKHNKTELTMDVARYGREVIQEVWEDERMFAGEDSFIETEELEQGKPQ